MGGSVFGEQTMASHKRLTQLVARTHYKHMILKTNIKIENPRVGGSIPPPGTILKSLGFMPGLFCFCPPLTSKIPFPRPTNPQIVKIATRSYQ